MSYIGLTVKQGDTLGLVLDFDPATQTYDVDFTTGRRTVKSSHVSWVAEADPEPDVALFRKSNPNSGTLAYTEEGWDVISTPQLDAEEARNLAEQGWTPQAIAYRFNVDEADVEQFLGGLGYQNGKQPEGYTHTGPDWEHDAPQGREWMTAKVAGDNDIYDMRMLRNPVDDPNERPSLHQGDPMAFPDPGVDYTETSQNPYMIDPSQPFNNVMPKPNPDIEYDSMFPTASVDPKLSECPECTSPLLATHGGNSPMIYCASCGHRQPVTHIQARAYQKTGFLPLAELAAGGVERGLAGIGGEGGEMAGQAASGNILSMADDLITGAGAAGGNSNANDPAAAKPDASQADLDMQGYQQHAGASKSDDEVGLSTDNSGRDVQPDAANQGYTNDVGDSPDLLKDVDTGVASISNPGSYPSATEAFQALVPYLEKAKAAGGDADDPVVKAIDELLKRDHPGEYKGLGKAAAGPACPACRKDISGATMCSSDDPTQHNFCPVFAGGTGQSQAPINNQVTPTQAPLGGMYSRVEKHERFMEKVAARRPKMCPFHDSLVTYALELGDPASATNALSRHMFGPRSCQGEWDQERNHKCRFKPQMIKQEWWDQKEAEAEQRKLEREQQNLPPIQDPNAIAPEVPVEQPSAVALPEVPGENHMVVQDIPSTEAMPAATDYVPEVDNVTSIESAPSFQSDVPLSPVQVAARVADAQGGDSFQTGDPSASDVGGTSSPIDTDGDPLQTNETYEVRRQGVDDFIPDIVTVTHATPQSVEFVVNGAHGISFQDSVRTSQIGSEVTFQKHHHNPNAHGEVNTTASLLKEAGRNYSIKEQRQFVDEEGSARNLDRLNLDGTHYVIDGEHDLNAELEFAGW